MGARQGLLLRVSEYYMDARVSFELCPFPIASLDCLGTLQSANTAWRATAASSGSIFDALGLAATDRDALGATLNAVDSDQRAAWIDLDIPVLVERRWSRCHVWTSQDTDDLTAAIIPLRETRDVEMSRVEMEHIERILEHTADAITIIGEDMSFRFASGIATRWLGVSGAAYEGQQFLSFVYPDDHHILLDAFTTCLSNPRLSIKARFRTVHENGDLIWVEGIGTNMFDDPAIQGILVTLNDITELVETNARAERNQSALEVEKQRYETLAHFTPTGVFELGSDNTLTFFNERFGQLMRISTAEEFSWDLFDAHDRDPLLSALARARTSGPVELTVRLGSAHDIGHQRWVRIIAARQDGGRILASIDDATLTVTKQAELAHRAGHDDLTGLPNRETLLQQLSELSSAGEPIALLFLDLDSFKDINDGLGHQVGDQVLIEIAERIKSVIRPHDIVGRLHGDEFLVVCRSTTEVETAHVIAARIVTAVGAPLSSSAQGLMVSGSVGIALSEDCDGTIDTPEQLLVAADIAMYEAKRLGGSLSVQYNHGLGKQAADRLRLHGEVQRAGELDELELHYQPIVDLTTRQVVGNEALIRWHHPTQGFILPGRFIPEIEKSELIDELGMWVLRHVIADLVDQGPDALPTNVNVSPRQLIDPTFAETAVQMLDDSGIDCRLLTIEITELVLLEDFGPVEKQLHLLRSRGVGVAVDDFGTGYSSMAYLQRFPFDQIKIDGLFIQRVDTNESDRAIVRSIIDLTAALGATVVAEKVERQQQADTLVELGCAYAQGYLLGKPLPLGKG